MRRDAGSLSASVRDKNFGHGGEMRHLTNPRCNASSARFAEPLLWLSRRLPHWTRRIFESTVGTMLQRFSVANVRACNSDTVAGGGVPGG